MMYKLFKKIFKKELKEHDERLWAEAVARGYYAGWDARAADINNRGAIISARSTNTDILKEADKIREEKGF